MFSIRQSNFIKISKSFHFQFSHTSLEPNRTQTVPINDLLLPLLDSLPGKERSEIWVSMAVSNALVGCPKLETLLNLSSTSTLQTPLGLIGVPRNNNRTRRGLIHRARCELSPSDSATISALEQLKNSAPDSKLSLSLSNKV